MLFRLYGDDSSDKKQSHLLTAGSVLGWPHNFDAAERSWESRLKRDKIAYFRSSDCENFHEEFDLAKLGGLSSGRAIVDSILTDLCAIMKAQAIAGVGVSLFLEDFRELVESNQKARMFFGTDPTVAVYKTLIKLTIDLLNRDWPESRNIPLSFLFDCHGKYLEAEKAYEQLTNHPIYGQRIDVISHGNDQKIPALQMADMMAYEARYKTLEWEGKREEREMYRKLVEAGRIYSLHIMNKEAMLTELSNET